MLPREHLRLSAHAPAEAGAYSIRIIYDVAR